MTKSVNFADAFNEQVAEVAVDDVSAEKLVAPNGIRVNAVLTETAMEWGERNADKLAAAIEKLNDTGSAAGRSFLASDEARDCGNWEQAVAAYAMYTFKASVKNEALEELFGGPVVRTLRVFVTLKWTIKDGMLMPGLDPDKNVDLARLREACDADTFEPIDFNGMRLSMRNTQKTFQGNPQENWGNFDEWQEEEDED